MLMLKDEAVELLKGHAATGVLPVDRGDDRQTAGG